MRNDAEDEDDSGGRSRLQRPRFLTRQPSFNEPASALKTYQLANQAEVPAVGLGTWKLVNSQARDVVKTAIEVGYRHIDCARIYANEPFVGQALQDVFRAKTVSRDELWITSKLWNDCHRAEHTRGALEQTLTDLQLDHVDLYLMHWPVALQYGIELPESGQDFVSLSDVPLLETWGAMEACVQAGLCRAIGVSNFSQVKLQHLIEQGNIAPAVNQVELHPLLQQNELLKFCNQQGVLLTAYSPLGSADRPDRLRKEGDPLLLEQPKIQAIAEKHGVTPAQVLIAWAIQRGTLAIPKTSHRDRLMENLAAARLALDLEDMQAIAQLDQHYRIIDGQFWAMPGSGYTPAQLWDE